MNVLIPIFAVLVSAPAVAGPLALKDAYRAALERTETDPLNQARVHQAEARTSQARAAYFPTLNFGANYQRQDSRTQSATAAAIFPGQSSYTRLSLSQSIYEGGRDTALFRGAKAGEEAANANRESARNALFSSVASAYFSVLSAEREVGNIRKASGFAKSRMKEIESRTDIGRSRKVDLLAAQAQLAVLESQLAAGEGTLTTVRDQFALATGLGRTAELADTEEEPREPAKIETYLLRLDKRPDIAAARALTEQSRRTARAAWGGHLPSLGVAGNYYITREGPQAGNLWDVGVTLTLPIFAGFGVNGRVRELDERSKELELSLALARRNAEVEIRTLHGNLASAVAQLRQLDRALKLTEENFKEQEKNYRFGQVTNLDVIQALTLDLDTRRTLDRTRYQAMSSRAALQAATAQIP